MPKKRRKLHELQASLYIECDNPARLNHDIEYGLPGWYSLDDDGVFREGVRPTYCRIMIHHDSQAKFATKNNRCSHKGCNVPAVRVVGIKGRREYTCGNHENDKPEVRRKVKEREYGIRRL